MTPSATVIRWIGARQPKRPWLAQIVSADGLTTETLRGQHATEALALEAAKKEISRRSGRRPT